MLHYFHIIRIYRGVHVNGRWRNKTNEENEDLLKRTETVRFIKIIRLVPLVHTEMIGHRTPIKLKRGIMESEKEDNRGRDVSKS